jgi:hypothetical protein
LFNIEEVNESITVGIGKSMMATKVASLRCCIFQVDGSGLDITLHNLFVPELWVNLLSISKVLKKGNKVSKSELSFSLSKLAVSVTFDKVNKDCK